MVTNFAGKILTFRDAASILIECASEGTCGFVPENAETINLFTNL